MGHDITLYGLGYTRSARCLWTLKELGLPHEYIEDRTLIHTDELRAMQPQAKLPVAIIDGHPLYESAAICTQFCDLAPGQELIAKPGTPERGLHMQWSSFALTEIETWLWSSYKHLNMYDDEDKALEVLPANEKEIRSGLQVVDDALANSNYLVADRFSVTDIIMAWPVNWARRMDYFDGMDNLTRYLDRLFARPHCHLNPE